jgi:probable HAF family extracellular repeat protein
MNPRVSVHLLNGTTILLKTLAQRRYNVHMLPGRSAMDVGTKINNLGSLALNNSDVVAGTTDLNATAWYSLWSSYSAVTLPVPSTSQMSMAFGINDGADIVGGWTPLNTFPGRAFLYKAGSFVDLGATMNAPVSVATDINGLGVITGYRGQDGVPAFGGCRSFVCDSTSTNLPQDLGVIAPNHGQVLASAINSHRHVTGVSRENYYTDIHAFLFDGSMRDLGLVYSANDLNEGDTVVGAQVDPDKFTEYRVAYRCDTSGGAPTYQALGVLSGLLGSEAFAINNSDDIVGYCFGSVDPLSGLPDDSDPAFWRAFVKFHDRPQMEDLNTLIPSGSGWQLANAYDINDRGDIVGEGFYLGQRHPFLLTPDRSFKLPYYDEFDPFRLLRSLPDAPPPGALQQHLREIVRGMDQSQRASMLEGLRGLSSYTKAMEQELINA